MKYYRFSLIIMLSQPASQSASQLAQEGLEPSWRKFREKKEKKRPKSRKSQFYIVKTSTYELSASKKQENLHGLMAFRQK